jgi:hypothetical protein
VVFVFAGKHDKGSRDLEQLRLLIVWVLESVLALALPMEEQLVLAFDLSDFKYSSSMDYDAV